MPGVLSVLLQPSQVRCTCSPSTRLAQSAAAWGDGQQQSEDQQGGGVVGFIVQLVGTVEKQLAPVQL